MAAAVAAAAISTPSDGAGDGDGGDPTHVAAQDRGWKTAPRSPITSAPAMDRSRPKYASGIAVFGL
jgi:hypothetical protein